jgi:hypothetical protein
MALVSFEAITTAIHATAPGLDVVLEPDNQDAWLEQITIVSRERQRWATATYAEEERGHPLETYMQRIVAPVLARIAQEDVAP